MSLRFSITVDDNANPAIKKLGPNANSASAAISKLGGVIAAAFTVRKIFEFAKASITAFDEQEKAITKLTTALGGYSDALINQASSLQAVTRYGDEVTIDAQALLATYGLSEKQILKLIPAIQDMASATGMDLSSAADLAGKSITSSTNALSRYGIDIDMTGTSTERLASLTESLTKRFEGQAVAAGNTGAGGLAKLSNKMGDLSENIGRGIVNFPLFTSAVNLANKALDVAMRITGGASEEYKQLAENIEQKSLPALIDFNEELKETLKIAPVVGMTLSAIATPSFSDPGKIKDIIESFKLVKAEADAAAVDISSSVSKINQAISKDSKKPKDKDIIDNAEPKDKEPLDRITGLSIDELISFENNLHGKLIDIDANRTEEERKEAEKRKQIAYDESMAKLAAMSMLFGGFASLAAHSKNLGALAKGLAITQALIDTYAGAQSAFTQTARFAPVPFAFAAAAGAVAFGLSNVARIKSQKFQSGTVFGNGGSTTDNIPAMLSPGEQVLSGRDVNRLGGLARLQAAINEGGASGAVTMIFNNPIGEKRFFDDYVLPGVARAMGRSA